MNCTSCAEDQRMVGVKFHIQIGCCLEQRMWYHLQKRKERCPMVCLQLGHPCRSTKELELRLTPEEDHLKRYAFYSELLATILMLSCHSGTREPSGCSRSGYLSWPSLRRVPSSRLDHMLWKSQLEGVPCTEKTFSLKKSSISWHIAVTCS